MTPQQLEPGFLPDQPVSPECILWYKVLDLGVYEASQYLRTCKDLSNESICNIHLPHVRQAVRWILSDAYYIGSFLWICEIVGYDSKMIRKHIIMERKGN